MLNTIIETTAFTSIFLFIFFILAFAYCKCKKAVFDTLFFIKLALIATIKVLILTNGLMLFIYYIYGGR